METLWQRHSGAARSWAAKRDPDAAEDVVSEAFALVFQALLNGGGPSEAFRAYLYRTMDSLFVKHWASQRRTARLDDLEPIAIDDAENSPNALSEAQEQRAAAGALVDLPERWRSVIAAVDVEGRPVHEVARSLGLSPNSTSVLLKRAREGLRRAWVERLHRPGPELPAACAGAVKHFGILRWGKQGTRRRLATEQHLEGCRSCRSRYAQFLEQATTIGLSITGLLAMTREWRQKLVPALATSATVIASFSVTALDPIPLMPSWPWWAQTDETPAPPETGAGPDGARGGAAGDAAAGPDGQGEGSPDAEGGSSDGRETEGADGGDGANGGRATDAGSDANGAASTHLYFGDWTGWNEEEQEFIVAH